MYEMTLESKRVVLLGGTAGIGLATAQAAAAAGARVVAVSSNPDNVAKALAELRAGAPGETVDLTREPEIKALFARLGASTTSSTPRASRWRCFLCRTSRSPRRSGSSRPATGARHEREYAVPHINAGGSIVLSSRGAVQRPMPLEQMSSRASSGRRGARPGAAPWSSAPIR